LQALITKHQRKIQDGMIGREISVLFEKLGRDEGQMVGKSEYLHAVHVANSNAQVGDIAKVRIVDAGTNSLRGEILS
jgi:tRNA-2-methylthio-N6-dimethylallyladenosine synthase